MNQRDWDRLSFITRLLAAIFVFLSAVLDAVPDDDWEEDEEVEPQEKS